MILGIGTGVVVGLLLVAIILRLTKTDGSMRCKYDERQMLARGKAFKYAFFTLVLCDAAYAFGFAIEPMVLVMDVSAYMIAAILFSALIYVSYCIWNDAYFSLNENRGRMTIIFGILGLLNLVLGIRSLMDGRGIEDGKLNVNACNLFVGITFVGVFLVMGIKWLNSRESDEE